ncbi:MAG: 2-methylcitrate synthase [Candidatus Heimdallarchaeota archaeon]|nr:MAG: 2-methylcitrate synthase [Candidatus Heimdallarchaeota archaeon]
MSKRKLKVKYKIDPGLRGINVGTTEICPVGEEEIHLSYRGYLIEDLAMACTYEEVSHLLIHGELPNKYQLSEWSSQLSENRFFPKNLQRILDTLPKNTHPMSVLRTAISTLGTIEPEQGLEGKMQALRILGILPSIIGYWEKRRGSYDKEVPLGSSEDTIAGYLLHMINGEAPSTIDTQTMDTSLILYAEHEYAASTYAARVCASTLADYYSCITTAIGTLSGPLNGGANEAAIKLLLSFDNSDTAESKVRHMLRDKELVMGFGHAVYADHDPRSLIVKERARKLSNEKKEFSELFKIAEAVERVMREHNLFPNLDFYTATVYHILGINSHLFTPIFVVSRSSGWAAHVLEQRQNNKLIRPTAEYIGPKERVLPSLSERK